MRLTARSMCGFNMAALLGWETYLLPSSRGVSHQCMIAQRFQNWLSKISGLFQTISTFKLNGNNPKKFGLTWSNHASPTFKEPSTRKETLSSTKFGRHPAVAQRQLCVSGFCCNAQVFWGDLKRTNQIMAQWFSVARVWTNKESNGQCFVPVARW